MQGVQGDKALGGYTKAENATLLAKNIAIGMTQISIRGFNMVKPHCTLHDTSLILQ